MTNETLTAYSSLVGIPIYAMVLLGIVPTIATLVSVGRHIIGFNSFSIYVPIITTIAFLELGLGYGVVVAALVFLTTILARRLLLQFRFHYFVRVSFVYTLVCFLLFLFIFLFSLLAPINLLDFKPLFPVILLVTLVEEYYKTLLKDGENKVFTMFLETIVISSASFLIISSAFFTDFVLNHIWILLLLFPINLILAGWEGLRFSELSRFKTVISSEMRRIQEEDMEGTKKAKKKKKAKERKEAEAKEAAKTKTNVFFW